MNAARRKLGHCQNLKKWKPVFLRVQIMNVFESAAASSLRCCAMQPFSVYLKGRLKNAAGCCFFQIFRWLERGLSPDTFYSLLKPFFGTRAAMNSAFKKSGVVFPARPAVLQAAATTRIARQARLNDYMNHVPEFFPERLGGEPWRQRCRIEGLARVHAARQIGRPVILAFVHFGPYFLLRHWLRAAGVPMAILRGSQSSERGLVLRIKDRYSPFPEVPLAFHSDQMRALVEFVTAGNVLGVPIDVPRGKLVEVPFSDGWTFQMASGAVRLATYHEAELLPCCIINEGPWRFSVTLGRPVPREFLAGEADWPRAGKHLLDEMLPLFQAHPEQCRTDLIRSLKPKATEEVASV
jgi:lauroyl/myristoyl acyltransferase